jgi:hypothetical protein
MLNAIHGAFREIDGCSILIPLMFEELLISNLLEDLFLGTNEGDPIDTGHYGLLDGLPFDMSFQFGSQILIFGFIIFGVPLNYIGDHPSHMRIQVTWLIEGIEIDLRSALRV